MVLEWNIDASHLLSSVGIQIYYVLPVLRPAPVPSVTIRALLLNSAFYLGCPLGNWVVGLLFQLYCRNQFSWVFGPQEKFPKLKEFSNCRVGRSEANFALPSELNSIPHASAVCVYRSTILGNCNCNCNYRSVGRMSYHTCNSFFVLVGFCKFSFPVTYLF